MSFQYLENSSTKQCVSKLYDLTPQKPIDEIFVAIIINLLRTVDRLSDRINELENHEYRD